MGWARGWRLGVFLASLVIVSAACKSVEAPITVPTTTTVPVDLDAVGGDATAGEELFTAPLVACFACHTIEGIAQGQIGPNLTAIGADVEARLADGSYTGSATDVPSYLREAIFDPNAFIAPKCPTGPCPSGVMPQTFAESLTSQELADLVAFLSDER